MESRTWFRRPSQASPGILSDIEADLERAPELIEHSVEIDEVSPEPALA